jgi:uncharacterized protein (TIGR03435 family)
MKISAPITVALAGIALAVTISVTPMPRVSAQTSPAPAAEARFEVASVKQNKSGDGRVMLSLPPTGRLTATNVPLRLLLQTAFDVQGFQLVGGPSWLASDRFDITAKAPEGAVTPEQVRPMLRSLLADRFKLITHRETRDMPIYALVVARVDGKFGPNMKVNPLDCEAVFRAGRGGAPPPPPQPGEPIQCGSMIGPGTMTAGGMLLGELARSLSQFVGRIVLDKTGLTERYDFQLKYAPEGRGVGPGPGPGGPDPQPVDPNMPSLFTALQEQLGLKLESQRGPVEVVVIDRVEQPTED